MTDPLLAAPGSCDPPSQHAADEDGSIWPLLAAQLQTHADRSACRYLGRSLSHRQIDTASQALAAYLQSIGLSPGDRLALMMPNLPQYQVATLAALRIGAVLVPVNPHFQGRELTHQLRDSGARAIVVADACAAVLQQVRDAVPALHIILATLGDMAGLVRGGLVNQWARRLHRQVPPFHLPDAVPFARALALGRRLPCQEIARGPQDIALLQYTGGTTAPAKGAVLLHRQLRASVRQAAAWIEPALARLPAGEQAVLVAALPMHHLIAFNQVLLLGLSLGACNLLLPDPRDVSGTLRALGRQRFHALVGTAALYSALASSPNSEQVDWSGLCVSVAAGMAVTPETAQLWHGLTGCPLCEGYGLSEACAAVTCNPVDLVAFSGHLGRVLPGTELRLVDDHGQAVTQGQPGEILVRGPQVMAGYWQRPEETAKVLDASGWFHTGDIGVVDTRGNLRLLDRKKDRIQVSGIDVYPTEVERLVTQLPGVLECAAVGVHSPATGEAVKLVVVRCERGEDRPSEAEIRAHCESHLGGHMRPGVVEFRDALPRTPHGGVLRRELRDGAEAVSKVLGG